MPCKKAPGTQGYKGKLNVPSCRVGKKEGMAEAIQRQEESTSSQQRGSWKLAPSSSERSLPFQLQLFTVRFRARRKEQRRNRERRNKCSQEGFLYQTS